MRFDDHPCTTKSFADHETRFGDQQTSLSCMDDPQTRPVVTGEG
jgi:hypothetical protein